MPWTIASCWLGGSAAAARICSALGPGIAAPALGICGSSVGAARLHRREPIGDVDLVDLADLLDRAAQVQLPRRAGRRVAQQREPVVDRAAMIARQVARDRQEIAAAGLLRVDRHRLAEGRERRRRHRIARARHAARLAQRRPEIGAPGRERSSRDHRRRPLRRTGPGRTAPAPASASRRHPSGRRGRAPRSVSSTVVGAAGRSARLSWHPASRRHGAARHRKSTRPG